jgi:hypothetical protein
MLMQMIERGGIPALTDSIRTADEDNPKGYYEFEPVKRTKKDPSWLKSAAGKVVKMVHLLLLDLPPECHYRVVFTRRKLEEVVASQNMMLERQGKSQTGLSQDKLIEMFEAQLLKVGRWLKDQPNFEVLYVDYNELLKDPEPSVKAINEFLGGHLDTEAMLSVVDPSLYRQRR